MTKNDLYNLTEFLIESNAIESEFTPVALADAIAAWNFASASKELRAKTILEIHDILMNNIYPAIAGRIRDCDVWVGGRKCPDPLDVKLMLAEWVQIHGKAKTKKSIIKAHVAFEKIHPFVDGNGRTGRIIMNWQMVKAGLPIWVIHTGDEQFEYYELFEDHDRPMTKGEAEIAAGLDKLFNN